ncbi:hypothetical protein JRO89_XS09G0021900 [Xanthoceras sorbifolium]|uniref:Peroxidase n=1 Tax=Xanthoceras sorbifolium TaxID=99658 RepID=A0ABQ8HK92_9ROSI|nr:hypothetical protein JRO89_XS09G0021900 [Xanthoceras sorbifolium]
MALLQSFLVCFVVVVAASLIPVSAQLTANFYDNVCPQALPTIRNVVQKAIKNEPRMGASLLRLHFHDCFVNGCDGSILLDDTSNFTGEKTGLPNLNSVRGFDVVDDIKEAVNNACKTNVVSCADILAIAARDSVAILLSIFQSHGLDLQDLIALSGGHTIGLARCTTFRHRIYNETNIDTQFATSKQQNCPVTGGDGNTEPLDSTTTRFDNQYFKDLLKFKGLLHSDQELFKGDGSASDQLVQKYSNHSVAFGSDFRASMIKMGNMESLTGNNGEIRMNCRKIN